MSERTGLGPVEEALLLDLDDMGAGPQRPHVKSAHLLAEIERHFAVAPSYGYQVACDLAHHWTVWLRLLDGHGNFGGPDDPPADPRYTELRLTPVGTLAVAAERGDGASLPIGLINGSIYAGGQRPPFSPGPLLRALIAVLDDPGIGDVALVDICGPPAFPTGSDVAGDVDAVLAGRPGTLRLTARVTPGVEAGHPVVRITNLPPGAKPRSVVGAIHSRVQNSAWDELPPELAASMRLPIADIKDASTDRVVITCRPTGGVDADDLAERLRTLWGVHLDVRAVLPAPLPALLRAWVTDHAGAGTGDTLRRLLAVCAPS